MGISFRLFKDGDITKISDFFRNIDKTDTDLGSGQKIIWDCFTRHPCFEMFHPEQIAIWENENKIVGIVRLESPWYGGVIIDVNPEYFELHTDMIQYAEKTYAGIGDNGDKYLNVYVRDTDKLKVSLSANGYTKGKQGRMLAFSLNDSIPDTAIREGFQIKSLEEVYDFKKLNDLLWKSFEYEGEPPGHEDDVYLPIKHAWLDYRRNICTVAEAEDNSYAAFCGMWFDKDTSSAFIEPLATCKRNRNLGLAKACIYESMKKCRSLGADIAFVEPDEEALDFYERIGFKEAYKIYCWSKYKL